MAKPKGSVPKKGKKNRKFGRNAKKSANRSKPLSMFVRGKITAQQYFALTNQKFRKE